MKNPAPEIDTISHPERGAVATSVNQVLEVSDENRPKTLVSGSGDLAIMARRSNELEELDLDPVTKLLANTLLSVGMYATPDMGVTVELDWEKLKRWLRANSGVTYGIRP